MYIKISLSELLLVDSNIDWGLINHSFLVKADGPPGRGLRAQERTNLEGESCLQLLWLT